jgi:hypothetical protein
MSETAAKLEAMLVNDVQSRARERKQIEDDKRYVGEHKAKLLQQHDEEADAEVLHWRGKILEALELERGQVQDEYHVRMRAHVPRIGPNWAEAAARAQFVKEDVEAMDPDEILEAYRYAELIKDNIGVYLLGRAGLAQLRKLGDVSGLSPEGAMQAMKENPNIGKAQRAADELTVLYTDDARAKRDEALNALKAIESRLSRPMTQAEKVEFAAKYDFDPRHVDITAF